LLAPPWDDEGRGVSANLEGDLPLRLAADSNYRRLLRIGFRPVRIEELVSKQKNPARGRVLQRLRNTSLSSP
ncbi:hypothetical protein, partial [Mesorhizobium sp.]|uniref:hypothetical protein n=1 Tax=Mesorhizobium sp. TaxID=1871066 RepID=UPI00257BBDB5